eukprot:CAMPEP_0204269638 /NCGR_PEP_ID=MMETSP0468-20130131/16716_1 /ASSEMBLY_ACC=CAM_ASM_000383 /TAXON_ID=2969 /ORGANISM="Oxyrrhis marina" /LENGTH=167 /DNA_ID=CAMNT_0051245043 /DNA_START=423 /DNA_END=926 /DNA_ORIENTATION=+
MDGFASPSDSASVSAASKSWHGGLAGVGRAPPGPVGGPAEELAAAALESGLGGGPRGESKASPGRRCRRSLLHLLTRRALTLTLFASRGTAAACIGEAVSVRVACFALNLFAAGQSLDSHGLVKPCNGDALRRARLAGSSAPSLRLLVPTLTGSGSAGCENHPAQAP